MGQGGVTNGHGVGRNGAAGTTGDPTSDGRVNMRPANLVRHRVEVHTVTLRVFGSVHVRAGVAMSRILNATDRPHVSLTDARLYARGVEHPPAPASRLYGTTFAAIPKSAVMWVVGGEAEEYQPSLQLEPRDTYLVYPTFVLAGTIHMRPEVRFSDAIGTALINRPFVTLNDARVLDRRAADVPIVDLPALRAAPFVTADLRKVTVIVDRDGGAALDVGDEGDIALLEDVEIDVAVGAGATPSAVPVAVG